MNKEREEENKFSGDLDRLVKGEKPEGMDAASEDYQKDVEFAGKMLESRLEPSPTFREDLKRRLLLKLAEREAQADNKEHKAPSFWETLKSLVPANPVWRVIAATASIAVIALVFAWVSGLLSLPGNEPLLGSPPGPTSVAQGPVEVKWTSEQTSYKLGEQVTLDFTFENKSDEPLTLTTFPPELIIAAKSLKPYKTVPGGSSRTLSPGEVVTYQFTWDQLDNEGQQVPPGNYVIEMLEIQLDNGKGTVTLLDSPQITIVAP